jgi:FkbM family methyltransferase
MLSRIAEFIYTVVLKPRPLRNSTNFVIRLLLPETVRYGESVVALNPNDPVVSGALVFRVYETAESEYIDVHLKPESVFIDVGANIGYYTALAMNKTRGSGSVIALEPDPECYGYLQKTVALNGGGKHVRCYEVAAGRENTSGTLYISRDNRGDNRLYDSNSASGSVPITIKTLDQIVKDAPLVIDERPVFIKIDVQGAEGEVIAGAQHLLSDATELTMMMEFWPDGLRQMGTRPQALLESLEALGLELFELSRNGARLEPIYDKQKLIEQHRGRKYTNIIAIKTKESDAYEVRR